MIMKIALMTMLCVLAQSMVFAGFGGKPVLGPKDSLRHEFMPYDLYKLNYLGTNYCENLLDMRVNTPAYTHLGFDSNTSDAWHLHFPDDAGRMMEGIAWEDQFSPVVRLELMRRMVKGMLAAHVPGTKGYYFFRHRSGGKTFLISDDANASKQGRLTIVNWGDAPEGCLSVGFRAEKNGQWHSVEQFKFSDDPESAANLGTARSAKYWNQSPFTMKRHYTDDALAVDFTGKYWLSDEDMPLEYAFKSSDADKIQIVIGESGKPMPLLQDGNAPGIIHLPDGKSTFSSDKTGDKTFDKPSFDYMILRKATAWGSPGYSTALLIMWEGHPDKIEALAPNGYGEIRLSYGKNGGKVWLYPFQWVNPNDMDYIHLNARSFLKNGKLVHNGYPSQQLVNAGAAGIAAGAYLLSKYNDPLAVTARINAANAVDELFDAEKDGMKLTRVFHVVKAAAWMVKTGKAINDKHMIDKYTPLVDQAMKRMLTKELGYDGKGWTSGWDHFNAIKATWLAYDATGNKDYLDAYERALTVYTIDSKGIYRYGVPMQAPGGFETYSGALALGAWGNAGKMEWVNALINLDVPNGWTNPEIPLKDIWNDAGAGPWAQDDANPEYIGYCLRGANIPQKEKYVLPLGSFPIYDGSGKVDVTRQPMVDNPYFPKGKDKLIVLVEGKKLKSKVKTTVLMPDGKQDILKAGSSKVYKLDTKGSSGAGIDLRLKGHYRIDVSPDGKRWYSRLQSWSSDFCDQSLDLSAFTGSHDELMQLQRIVPEGDIIKLDLRDVTECWLESIVGNGDKIQCSSDGQSWHDELDASQIKAVPEAGAGWLRMLDISKYLGGKSVFLKLSDMGDPSAYLGQQAFWSRVTVYGVLNSGSVLVKLTNTSDTGDALCIDEIVFRNW